MLETDSEAVTNRFGEGYHQGLNAPPAAMHQLVGLAAHWSGYYTGLYVGWLYSQFLKVKQP